MPGVELGVAYVDIVPSARDFGDRLRREVNGRNVGRGLGDDVNAGMAGKLGDVDLPTRRLRDSASRDGASIGASLRSGIDGGLSGLKTAAVAMAGIGVGAVVIGKQFFDAFSDLNESTTKAQTVFGDAFARVDAFATGAAKSIGQSHQQALEAAGTFGNLFRAMGIGTDTAADMSTSLLQLSGDLASFNNADPDEVLTALKAGLVGETEPMRRFGVNLTADRIAAKAFTLGIAKTTVNVTALGKANNDVAKAQAKASAALKEHGESSQEYRDAAIAVETAQAGLTKALAGQKPELNAAQKAQASYALIMEDTTLAQGDYARTADGAANKTRTLGAQWDDFKAKVGKQLAPLGDTVLSGLSTGLDTVSTWWDANGANVLTNLGTLKTKFTDIFGPDPVASFTAGADIVKAKFNEVFGDDPVANYQAGADIISAKVDGMFGEDKIGNFLAGAATVTDAVDGFATALDDLFGPDKQASFATGADTVRAKFDELSGEFERGSVQIYQGIGPAWEWLGRLLVGFKDDVLDPVLGFMQEKWNKELESNKVGQLVDAVASSLNTGLDVLEATFKAVGGTFEFIKDKVVDPVVGAIQAMLGQLDNLKANPIAGAVGKALNIPGFAAGGLVPGPTGAPRLIVAHGGETVVPARAQVASLSGGAGLTIGHLEVKGADQPTETAFAIRSELRWLSMAAGGT